MSSSMKVDVSKLKELAARMVDPQMIALLNNIAKEKAVAGLVAQAIADNFAEQGPDWQPLRPETIRRSVGKAQLKRKASKKEPHRMILQKTGLLKKSVTTPGAQGNIYRVDGTNIIWGTNLVYAAIHNSGGTISHPGTKNGFGRGILIPPHSITIPKREFLIIRDIWKEKIQEFMVMRMTKIIGQFIKGRG